MTTPPSPLDVRYLLSADDLTRLRAGYSYEYMLAGARYATELVYPPITDWTEFMLTQYYISSDPNSEEGMAQARRREELVVTIMTTNGETGLTLAVHLYWALMVGLSTDRLANAMMLAACYSGMDRFTNAVGTLSTLIAKVLRPALDATGGDLTSKGLVGVMKGVFT